MPDDDDAPQFGNMSDAQQQAYRMGQMHGSTTDKVVRRQLATGLGESFGGTRDIYDALGWTEDITLDDYWNKYLRNPLGRTVVDAPAKTAWRSQPVITDDDDSADSTGFEAAVNDLFREHRLLEKWMDADRIAGIGQFGLLVIGAHDGNSLDQPLTNADDVAYFQPVAEDSVKHMDVVKPTDAATDVPVGMPVEYELDLSEQSTENHTPFDRHVTVHHSRVIHIAENTLDSRLYGRPRMEAVYNLLEDAEKVLGSSAEMAWRGADYGMLLAARDGFELEDPEAIEDEVMAYYHGLQPYLRTQGLDVERLGGEEYDPSGVMDQILKLIAGETGIPQRILTGSERGELASSQDRASWLGRMAERQQHFCEPVIVRPTIQRLVDAGILPAPEGGHFEVQWPTLFELSEPEKAQVMADKAAALRDAAAALTMTGAWTAEEVRQEVLGWEPEIGTQAKLPEGADTADDDDILRDIGPDVDDVPDGAPDVDDEMAEQWAELNESFQ